MGLFDNLFSKDSKQEKEKGELYRANLFQKNIASQIEADSLEIAISFQHSLVNISAELFTVKTVNGEQYSFPISFSEKDISTTTHIGKFQNGCDFRLIQPTDLSLDMAKSNHNALGAFTLGSVNPNGWAVHFFLTDKEDIRQTDVSEKGSAEQILKLIQGSMMGIQFGMPEKFIEFSKRLLPMIESNPSQLHNYDDSSEFIQVMKSNLEAYDDNEKSIINRIYSIMNLDFVFKSPDHLRYENGIHVSGPHGGAGRAVKVEPNINGGKGCSVTLYNLDGDHPVWQNNVQMAPKQMEIIQETDNKVVLRGYGHDNMGGSFADYGLTIHFENGQAAKCILHMHDRGVDIEYMK